MLRTINILADLGNGHPVVIYRCKIKQHGVNTSVYRHADGVTYYSKNGPVKAGEDLCGFYHWASKFEAQFLKLPIGTTVFGEWCGPGVEQGMAVSQLKTKVWAIFAVVVVDGSEDPFLTYEPEEISTFIEGLNLGPQVHVLPWFGDEFIVNFADRPGMDKMAEDLSCVVEQVEAEDPWVEAVFGVKGVGEGVVCFPTFISESPARTSTQFATYAFKAKGEKHKTVGSKKPVEVDLAVAASVQDFALLVLPEGRLMQGLSAVDPLRQPQNTGKFIQWILEDVRKETAGEMAASGLTWDQVKSKIQQVARDWWIKRSA